MTLEQLIEKKREDYDKEFPAFDGSGAPFPIFAETPNRSWVFDFIKQAMREAAELEGSYYKNLLDQTIADGKQYSDAQAAVATNSLPAKED